MINIEKLTERLTYAERRYEDATLMIPRNKFERHNKELDLKYWEGRIVAYQQVFHELEGE